MTVAAENVLFERVLSHVYDASAGNRWDVAIESIRDATGSAAACMFFQDRARPAPQADVLKATGYPEHATAHYINHYAALDVRVPAASALRAGEVYLDDRTMAFSQIQASAIYNEFYRPADLAHCMACTLFAENTRSGYLSLHRSHRSGAFRPAETNFLERLAPHLIRALQLQRQIERAQALAGGLQLALDHFQTAVMLVDSSARLVHANAAADALLCRTEAPLRLAGGHLVTTLPTEAMQFQQFVALASNFHDASAPIMSLTGSGQQAVSVMGAPLRRLRRLGLGDTPLAILFMAEPRQAGITDADRLVRQFGLSPAEAAVAVRVYAGLAIKDIAAARSVGRETVRSQLKSILNKMDLRTQSQLVGEVSRSLARLRS